MDISYSEISDWEQCHRKHHFGYKDNLKPNVMNLDVMAFGRMVHAGLQGFYDWKGLFIGSLPYSAEEAGRWAAQAWWDRWIETWKNDLDPVSEELAVGWRNLAYLVLDRYFAYAFAQGDIGGWDIVTVEKSLRWRIPHTPLFLTGTLDLLVRYEGKLWIVDHKTVKQLIDPKELDYNSQFLHYAYLVWRIYGELPAGAIYNQIVKGVPEKPDAEMKLPDKTHMPRRERPFFAREIVYFSREELESYGEAVKRRASEIRAAHRTSALPDPRLDPQKCLWRCSFKTLCDAARKKGDVDYIKDRYFYVQEGKTL